MSLAFDVASSHQISTIDVSTNLVQLPATGRPPDNTAVPLKMVSSSAPKSLPSYVLYDPDTFMLRKGLGGLISEKSHAEDVARAFKDI